jgi:hypothetical protein
MSPRPLSVVALDKRTGTGPFAASLDPPASAAVGLTAALPVRVGIPPTSRTAPVPEMLTKGIVRADISVPKHPPNRHEAHRECSSWNPRRTNRSNN